MDNQENSKQKLLEEIKQNETKIVEIIGNLEKEINILRDNILKKQMLLNEINTKLEEDNNWYILGGVKNGRKNKI